MTDWLQSLAVDPLLSWPWIIILVGAALIAAIMATVSGLRSDFQRLLAALFLAVALLNPQKVSEDREPLPDTAIILLDQSESMTFGNRTASAEQAEQIIRERLSATGNIDVLTVAVPPSEDGTRLASALTDALGSVPADRLAGVVAVTDGRVHDISDQTAALLPENVPFHALIVGDENARDRRISAITAPKFGVVGELADFILRVDDPGYEGERAQIEVRLNGERKARFPITIGDELSIPLEIEKRGRNTVEMTVVPAEGGELTLNNNLFISELSGIRDRMRVLLITGEPHNGGRAWRNLLKSDPAIDLVQFTILTQPRVKSVNASERELSLIQFPTRQLFEESLDDFDMIIFDQYQRRNLPSRSGLSSPTILPRYFDNISRYVEDGGALLLATGPAFASEQSLFLTPLVAVLPTRPTGQIDDQPFRAELNEKGRVHPITRSFAGREDQVWGEWYRSIGNDPLSGNVLMEAEDGTPLFIIDRVADGRVAMLMSDQAWLWAKGHDGGGPYREMFRRTAHWLLGEPDLDAETLTGVVRDGRLYIERQSLEDTPSETEVIFPDGRSQTVSMSEAVNGISRGDVEVGGPGAYRLSNGDLSTIAAVGTLNPLEYTELLSTAEIIQPFAEATGGRVFELGADMDLPDIRRVTGNSLSGGSWIGFRDNEAFTVTRSQRDPIGHPGLFFLAFFAALAWAWMREAR